MKAEGTVGAPTCYFDSDQIVYGTAGLRDIGEYYVGSTLSVTYVSGIHTKARFD
jgi:hypothetical protein